MPPKNLKKNIKIIQIKEKPEENEEKPEENQQEPEPPQQEPEPPQQKEEIILEDIINDVDNEPPKEDIKEEASIEKKPKGREDRSYKVTCPDCGKTLTKKTFEYCHAYTCKAVKAKKKEEDMKAKQKEKEEQQQLKKQQEENILREKIQRELEEKYKNNTN